MVETRSPSLKQAVAKLREYSADERTRLEAEAREKAIRDYRSNLNSAERAGRAEGEKHILSLVDKISLTPEQKNQLQSLMNG